MMMKNETKRDVFEAIADKCAGYNDELYKELLSKYDDALPDDMPVIPKEVAYVIKQAKKDDYKLGWVFYATYTGLWKDSICNWIRTNADTFARAWLDGYTLED